MKYTKLALMSSLTVLGTTSLEAQGSPWIGQSRVTIALTKSVSAPGIDAKDEAGAAIAPKTKVYSNYFMNAQGAEINEGIATIAKSRFSNLELLRYILSREKLKPESKMKSVVGWSLVIAYDDAESIDGLYIQRKIRGNKVQVINASEYLSSDEMGLNVDVQDDNILKITKNEVTTKTATLAEFGCTTLRCDPKAFLTADQLKLINSPMSPSLEMPNMYFSLTGTDNTSYAWDKTKMLDAIKGFTLSNLIGRYSYSINNDSSNTIVRTITNVIVDGSVTGAASTFINADRFLEGLQGAMPQPYK